VRWTKAEGVPQRSLECPSFPLRHRGQPVGERKIASASPAGYACTSSGVESSGRKRSGYSTGSNLPEGFDPRSAMPARGIAIGGPGERVLNRHYIRAFREHRVSAARQKGTPCLRQKKPASRFSPERAGFGDGKRRDAASTLRFREPFTVCRFARG